MAGTKMSLKLLIDKNINRVLLAEANKEFVDFLFHIMSLPIGTVVGLLKDCRMEGGLQNLYKSIENLSQTYFQPDQNKDTLLKPKVEPSLVLKSGVPLLLSNVEFSTSTSATKFYRCNNNTSTNSKIQRRKIREIPMYKCLNYVANDPNTICPSCNGYMNCLTTYVEPPNSKNGSSSSDVGYVKKLITYMVMDDLEVNPMSSISSITTLLNKFNIKDIGSLEEKVIHFGMDEGLNLLKASLHSKTVLTHVFLSMSKPKREFN